MQAYKPEEEAATCFENYRRTVSTADTSFIQPLLVKIVSGLDPHLEAPPTSPEEALAVLEEQLPRFTGRMQQQARPQDLKVLGRTCQFLLGAVRDLKEFGERSKAEYQNVMVENDMERLNLQAQIDQLKDENHELLSQVRNLEVNHSEATQGWSQTAQQKALLERKLADQESQVKSTQARISEKQQQLDQLQKEINKLRVQQTITDIQATPPRPQEQRMSHRRTLGGPPLPKTPAKSSEATAKIEQLKQEANTQERHSLQQEVNQLQEAVAKYKEKIEELKTANSELFIEKKHLEQLVALGGEVPSNRQTVEGGNFLEELKQCDVSIRDTFTAENKLFELNHAVLSVATFGHCHVQGIKAVRQPNIGCSCIISPEDQCEVLPIKVEYSPQYDRACCCLF